MVPAARAKASAGAGACSERSVSAQQGGGGRVRFSHLGADGVRGTEVCWMRLQTDEWGECVRSWASEVVDGHQGGSRLGSAALLAVIGSGSLECLISMRDTSTVIIRPHSPSFPCMRSICAIWGPRGCTLAMPTACSMADG